MDLQFFRYVQVNDGTGHKQTLNINFLSFYFCANQILIFQKIVFQSIWVSNRCPKGSDDIYICIIKINFMKEEGKKTRSFIS